MDVSWLSGISESFNKKAFYFSTELINDQVSLHTSHNPESYIPLLHDNTAAGPDYFEAVERNCKQTLFNTFVKMQQKIDLDTPVAIVDVPRGGLPLSDAAATVFSKRAFTRSFSSQIKTDAQNLFPAELDFTQTKHLVLADGIIGTGSTIVQHLDQIPQDWDGTVYIANNALAELGLEAICNAAEDRKFKMHIMTGRIYSKAECDYITFDNGKTVYFVGMADGIPDFGDKVTDSIEEYKPN